MIFRDDYFFEVWCGKNRLYSKDKSCGSAVKVLKEVLYGKVTELVYECAYEGAFPHVKKEIPVYIIVYGYKEG